MPMTWTIITAMSRSAFFKNMFSSPPPVVEDDLPPGTIDHKDPPQSALHVLTLRSRGLTRRPAAKAGKQ